LAKGASEEEEEEPWRMVVRVVGLIVVEARRAAGRRGAVERWIWRERSSMAGDDVAV
jgi:hypothetical protein